MNRQAFKQAHRAARQGDLATAGHFAGRVHVEWLANEVFAVRFRDARFEPSRDPLEVPGRSRRRLQWQRQARQIVIIREPVRRDAHGIPY